MKRSNSSSGKSVKAEKLPPRRSTSKGATGSNITYLSERVYDAGGGAGRTNLNFSALADGQRDMFMRTIELESKFEIAHREQEERQLTVDDKPISLTVNVAREDFPDVSADVEVSYFKSASQQGWDVFLKQVCKLLKIEFIHSILDRSDKSPVFRVLRLRPKGEYLVRQRESSAILEVINTGKNPVEVSWEVTADINHIKRELAFDLKTVPALERRVEKLVSKPMTRDREIEAASLILAAATPEQAVSVLEEFHLHFVEGVEHAVIAAATDDEIAGAMIGYREKPDVDFSDVAKFKGAIDIVSLHRMCLESLGRFVARGQGAAVVKSQLRHIIKVIEGLRGEADVVVLGLKLLSDLAKHLTASRDKIFHVVLDCVQAYSPPAPPHRPRNPARLKPPAEYDEQDNVASMLAGLNFEVTEVSSAGHIEMRRYGDFYGHSAVCDPLHDRDSSEMLAIVAIKEEQNAGIVVCDEEGEGGMSDLEDEPDVLRSSNKKSDTAVSEIKTGNAKPTEIKAIIRGRRGVDHGAAAKALSSAYSATPTIAAGDTIATASTDTAIVTAHAMTMEASYDAVSIADKVKSKNPPRFRVKEKDDKAQSTELQSGKRVWKGSIGEIGRRAVKAEVEVKIDFRKTAADVVDPFADEPFADDYQSPTNATSASVGNADVIATIAADANRTDVDNAALTTNATPDIDTRKITETAVTTAASTAMTGASSSGYKPKKKRKQKFVVQPLPLVPCLVFSGFSGKMKQSVALLQAFATLFKMVSQNYGNRELAFRLGVVDEICDVALVCQGMPRVLEYIMWIVDAMYSEGFGEAEDADCDVLVLGAGATDGYDDYSMQLSVSISGTAMVGAANNRHIGSDSSVRSLDTMENAVFETVSEMSAPSVDEDDHRSEATPVVNMGQHMVIEGKVVIPAAAPAEETDGVTDVKAAGRPKKTLSVGGVGQPVAAIAASAVAAVKATTPTSAAGAAAAAAATGAGAAVAVSAEEEEKTVDITNVAVGNNNKAKTPKNKRMSIVRAPNKDIVKVIGLAMFEARYVQRPGDTVVLAMSLIAHHHEIDARERQMATRWLDTWDDCSREFKLLRRKGADMCGI